MLQPGKLAVRDCSSNTRFTLGAWHLAKRLNMSTRMCFNTTILCFSLTSLSHTHPPTQRALYVDVISQDGRISKLLAALVPPQAPLHKHYINLNSSILYNIDRKLNSRYVR